MMGGGLRGAKGWSRCSLVVDVVRADTQAEREEVHSDMRLTQG